MSKCDLEVVLDRNRVFAGEKLTGKVLVRASKPVTTKSLTVHLTWRTHGKGNRDSGTVTSQTLQTGELRDEMQLPFEFNVPNGPLTYHGELINIEWTVNARGDIDWAIDPKAEAVFVLAPGGNSNWPYNHGGGLPTLGPEPNPLATPVPVWAKFLGMAVSGGGVIMAVLAWRHREYFLILMGVAIAIVPLFISYMVLKRQLAERRIGPVQFDISTTELRPGEPLKIAIELSPPQIITINGVAAVLRGYERSVCGSGTRKSTRTKEFHRSTHPLLEGPQRLPPGEPTRFLATVSVPADAPPSFCAANNQICWELDVRVDIPSWPDWTNTATLAVKTPRGNGAP